MCELVVHSGCRSWADGEHKVFPLSRKPFVDYGSFLLYILSPHWLNSASIARSPHLVPSSYSIDRITPILAAEIALNRCSPWLVNTSYNELFFFYFWNYSIIAVTIIEDPNWILIQVKKRIHALTPTAAKLLLFESHSGKLTLAGNIWFSHCFNSHLFHTIVP